MNQFQTIYEVSNESIGILWLLPLAMSIVGILFMFSEYYHIPSNQSKNNRLLFFGVHSTITFLFFILSAPYHIYNYYTTMKIYQNKEFKVVEGVVQNYKEIDYKTESFEVDGVKFKYEAFFIFFGYKKTKFYGGLIDNDKYVKIAYINKNDMNIILKLEMILSQ